VNKKVTGNDGYLKLCYFNAEVVVVEVISQLRDRERGGKRRQTVTGER
jgi:hypothetical protein